MSKNLYAVIFKWFWAILPGQKQLSLCIFKEYGFQSLKMAWYSKTYTLLTSLHSHLDHADDYNRVIGISKYERKIANTHPNKRTHPPTHQHTHTQTSELDDYNKISLWLSLKTEMLTILLVLDITGRFVPRS